MEKLGTFVEKILSEQELNFKVSETEDEFNLTWKLDKCTSIPMYICITSNTVKIFAEYGVVVEENAISNICEFCARVNSRMKLTRLELDFDDYHLGVHIANGFGENIDDYYDDIKKIILSFIYLTAHTMDELHDPIMHVLYGNASPKSAFDEWMHNIEDN